MAEKKKLTTIFAVAAAAAIVGLSGYARMMGNNQTATDPLPDAQNTTLAENQSTSKFTFVPGGEFKETVVEQINGGTDAHTPAQDGIVSTGPGIYLTGKGPSFGVGPGIKIR